MSRTVSSTARRCLDVIRTLAIGLVILLALLVHLGPSAGLTTLAVRGPSMEPAIPLGALVVTREAHPESIRVGDIVTIRADNGVLITHRVVRVTEAGQDHFLEIKGDANAAPDARLVPERNVIGPVIAIVPLVGYLVAMLSSAVGTLSILTFLCLLVLIAILLEELEEDEVHATHDRAMVSHPGKLAIGLVLSLTGFLVGGEPAAAGLLGDSENDASALTTAASFGVTYELHNNPTPPTGDTNAQANLLLDTSTPTATTLWNYDQDRNSDLGRTIAKGGAGAGEADLTKYQNWRTGVLGSARTINGTVTVDFWSGVKNFDLGKQGAVTAILRDYNPGTNGYTTIASGTLTDANWQGGSSNWVRKALTMMASGYTVESGHQIELKILVDSSSGDDMWFAYDTTAYDSTLALP